MHALSFLPWGLVFVWSVSFFFHQSKSRIRAIIDAAVLHTAISVSIAEITSLFTAYNLLWVAVGWMVAFAIVLFFHKSSVHAWKPLRDFFHFRPLDKREKLLMLFMLATIALALFKIFLAPPNSPTDSIQYHQPRAFMYYKNQSIHAYATSYGHMLYFGPLNAILMSQLQIMCGGWDGMYQLVQFTAYLLTMLAIYQTAFLLAKNRWFALVGAAMVCFMPMAHLQASTTQSDLLVSCFCAVAAYYMVQIWQDINQKGFANWSAYIVLGLSCGLAVLSKLTAGVTLASFVLLFTVALFIKLRRSALVRLGAILLCALVVLGGFWTRNAADWNGDFLPVSYSGSRPDYQAIGAKGTALIAAKALATTIASPHEDLPRFLSLPSYSLANAMASMLRMDLNAAGTNEVPQDSFSGVVHILPDDISYPLHSILVFVALLFFVVFSIRKKNGWLLAYTLCSIVGILATSTQYLWIPSVNRYLCPPFILALPLVAYMLSLAGRKSKGWLHVTTACLAAMFLFNVFCSVIRPAKDIKAYRAFGFTYNERLLRSMDPSSHDYWRTVNQDIITNGYEKIAFDSQTINGDYYWMRAFASPNYEVHYINANIRPDLEAKDFQPDCIIGSYEKGMAPDRIEYNDAIYIQKYQPTGIFSPIESSPRETVYYCKDSSS